MSNLINISEKVIFYLNKIISEGYSISIHEAFKDRDNNEDKEAIDYFMKLNLLKFHMDGSSHSVVFSITKGEIGYSQ